MASKLSAPFLLLVLLSILAQPSVSTAAQEPSDRHLGLKVGKISSGLSSKGYISMSLILEETLTTLVSNKSTTVTIFSPPDKAFFSSSKYPQPPFTLLQYHIVPLKLDREVLESSLPFESKVDTLLPGHPLVVTTLPGHAGPPSINGVKITEWDLYNDGRVIVHGVEDFFDPAFQTLLYPWYGDEVTENEGESSAGSNSINMDTKDLTEDVSGISPAFFLLAVLIFTGMCLFIAGLYCRDPEDSEYFYI